MAVPWGLATFLIGMAHGAWSPRLHGGPPMMANPPLVGGALALGLVALGLLAGANPLGLGMGIVDVAAATLVLWAAFLAGSWLGHRIAARPRDA